MPVIASAAPARPLVPPGQYPARCIDVYSAGWWKKMDSEEHVEKVKIVFAALVGQAEEYDDAGELLPADPNATPEVRYIDLFETLSLGKKANLRKFLDVWRGKPFTEEELKGFDLEKLLGAPALVSVAHKAKADGSGTRAVISSIIPLPGPMRKSAPQAPADYIPDAKREKPFASEHPNPAEKKKAPAPVNDEDFPGALDDEDDDLPF